MAEETYITPCNEVKAIARALSLYDDLAHSSDKESYPIRNDAEWPAIRVGNDLWVYEKNPMQPADAHRINKYLVNVPEDIGDPTKGIPVWCDCDFKPHIIRFKKEHEKIMEEIYKQATWAGANNNIFIWDNNAPLASLPISEYHPDISIFDPDSLPSTQVPEERETAETGNSLDNMYLQQDNESEREAASAITRLKRQAYGEVERDFYTWASHIVHQSKAYDMGEDYHIADTGCGKHLMTAKGAKRAIDAGDYTEIESFNFNTANGESPCTKTVTVKWPCLDEKALTTYVLDKTPSVISV